MKKSRKQAKHPKSKKRSKDAQSHPASDSRRSFLSLAIKGAIGLGAVAIVGGIGVRTVQAGIYERDLTRIGNGLPTIVQVHDPSCPSCTQLQKEARRALKSLDGCEFQYLVADLNTETGAQFARQHGVTRVTLVLLDGQGRAVSVLNGVRQQEELEGLFQTHQRNFGRCA